MEYFTLLPLCELTYAITELDNKTRWFTSTFKSISGSVIHCNIPDTKPAMKSDLNKESIDVIKRGELPAVR